MSARVRKITLVAHIVSSLGWTGAVGCFLALSIYGVSTSDVAYMRAAYMAMAMTGWSVVMPLSVASLATGVLQALGTPWGMFRHYWVSVKLWLSTLATLVLLLHLRPTSKLAEFAARGATALESSSDIRYQLIADAAAALLVLVLVTVLAVFKPAGLTRSGHRSHVNAGSRVG